MLIEIIKEITEEKIAKRIVPNYALELEILRRNKGMTAEQLHLQARMLSGAGLIKIGQTLNSYYYQLLNYEPCKSF